MKYSSKQLQEIFLKQPASIRELVTSPDISEILGLIYEKYGLNDEQAGNLGDEVGLFFMNLVKKEDIVGDIQNELKVLPETAQKIYSDINTTIFKEFLNKNRYEEEERGADKIESNPEAKIHEADSVKENILNEIENPTPSVMHTEITNVPHASNPTEQITRPAPKVPEDLLMVQDHHDLMRYYPGTEPIRETPPGLPELKPKPKPVPDQKKIVETPRYTDSTS